MARKMIEADVCDDCGTPDNVAEWPQIGGDLCDDCAHERFARLCISCGNSGEAVDGNKHCSGCAEVAAWDAEERDWGL